MEQTQYSKALLKIGHRGAMAYVAENTLESIQHALNLAVDGIEIDVHQCKSGELVVFHDTTLDRVTNGTGNLSDKTLEELKILFVAGKYRIPTLEEVLDLVNGACVLNIELKGENTAKLVCLGIQNQIKTKGRSYKDFIVSSFQRQELKHVLALDSKLQIGVLIRHYNDEVLTFAKSVNAYAIHPNYEFLRALDVSKMPEFNYKVIVWTVNEILDIQRLKSYGVDGLISDRPDLL